MNLDSLISLKRFQTSRSPDLSMAMKEDAPDASLTDGRQVTQPCLLTDNETGSALEEIDGNPFEMKGGKGLLNVCNPFLE